MVIFGCALAFSQVNAVFSMLIVKVYSNGKTTKEETMSNNANIARTAMQVAKAKAEKRDQPIKGDSRPSYRRDACVSTATRRMGKDPCWILFHC